MNDADQKLRALVAEALGAQAEKIAAPDFQHVWTRARAVSAARADSPQTARLWTAAATLAVLLAVGIGIRGLQQPGVPSESTDALMRELSANLYWKAPSDRMVGLADRALLNELPDIPMIDTTPEELQL